MFADEIFRVFATSHPGVALSSMNAEPLVQQMINRALMTQVDDLNGSPIVMTR